jgi:hypothetical protein
MAKAVIWSEDAKNLKAIPVSRRIYKVVHDVREQLIQKIKKSDYNITIQFDESTDFSNIA